MIGKNISTKIILALDIPVRLSADDFEITNLISFRSICRPPQIGLCIRYFRQNRSHNEPLFLSDDLTENRMTIALSF